MAKMFDLSDSLDFAGGQAAINRFNQFTPFGSQIWDIPNVNPRTGLPDPSMGATLTQELSPELQAIMAQQLQNQQALGQNVAGQLGSNFAGNRKRVEQSVFDRALNLLRPELNMQERRMNQTLADQGLPIGGEAVSRERSRFDRNRAQQLENLALSSVLAGGQEQTRQIQNMLSQFGASQGLQQPNFYAPAGAQMTALNSQAPSGPGSGAGVGSGLGTLAGAGIGAFFGGPAGALLGAGIGGGAGGALGSLFG